MCKYKRGDVVWALCAYTDGSGVKPRPCIVCKTQDLSQSCKYFIIECSTFKEKHSGMKGINISESHSEFSILGFEEHTFITETKAWLPEMFLKPPANRGANPIGFCNFIDSICSE
jgi:hypothetical protein